MTNAHTQRPRSVRRASRTDEWTTPHLLHCQLVHQYGQFTLDAAASSGNALARSFYTVADDGLSREWFGRVWCNPPYGRSLHRWVRKGYEAGKRGHLVVMLLPANTDTAWWHDYCERGAVRFIRGRLRYGDGIGRAPFGSALVVFGSKKRPRRFTA